MTGLKRGFWSRALGFIVILALAIFYVRHLRSELIFHPDPALYRAPADYQINYDQPTLSGADGQTFSAWFAPGSGELAFIIFSGNGGNMSQMADRLAAFHAAGWSVLTVDYPGYGQSEGRPSEEGTYRAAEAAWRYLTETKKFKPEKIVVYGFSLGGGVAAYLAEKYRPGALILDSTFTRLADVPTYYRAWSEKLFRLLMRGVYDTGARLARIDCPLIVLHCAGDAAVPYAMGRALFESYENGPKLLVTGRGGHLDFLLNKIEYMAAIQKFLNERE